MRITLDEMPEELAYLVGYLREFRSGSVSWQEINAWIERTGRNLAQWEATALMTLDGILNKGESAND